MSRGSGDILRANNGQKVRCRPDGNRTVFVAMIGTVTGSVMLCVLTWRYPRSEIKPFLTSVSLFDETLPKLLRIKPCSSVKSLSNFILLRVGIEPSTNSEGSSKMEFRRLLRFDVIPQQMKSLEALLCFLPDRTSTGRRLTWVRSVKGNGTSTTSPLSSGVPDSILFILPQRSRAALR